ncbi:MAG: Holliday junction branch migration protein RuvA [Thermodesulfovibrio sp.]|nr:Holliday junction branch migration protein RuvA [Thermodesulfovibrio sp.]
MIGSLRGKIISRRPDSLLVEVNGVGYAVTATIPTLANLPADGREVFLYIHTHVREDALQLFGFESEDEKRTFLILINISGIGPKVALNILSGMPYNDFLRAIETEDITMLCRIPGLGKKTAGRLVLELREKLPAAEGVRDKLFEDTLSALINLGYKRNLAQDYLEQTYKKGHTDIENLLKETLKLLTGNA